MKKQPKTSLDKLAPQVHKALEGLGVTVAYCQVLEALARATGHRTLHVAQARAPLTDEPVALKLLAVRLASRVFFKRTGRWEGKELELLTAVDRVFAMEASEGGSYVEASLAELLEEGRPVEVNAAFDTLRVDEWKTVFDALVQANMTELGIFVQTPAEVRKPSGVFSGRARDWRVADGTLEPTQPDAQPWDVSIATYSGDQFYLELCQDKGGQKTTHGVMLEIDSGIPVVRVSTDADGDVVLSAHITPDGLYLTPGYSDETWHAGAPPQDSPLHRVYEEQAFVPRYSEGGDNSLIPVATNHRFIMPR